MGPVTPQRCLIPCIWVKWHSAKRRGGSSGFVTLPCGRGDVLAGAETMNRISTIVIALFLPFALCSVSPVPAFSVTAENKAATEKSADVAVAGDAKWVDTGMDVAAGDKLHITAAGTVDFSDKPGVGPAGAERGWKDTLRALSVPSAGRGALVGQIGNDRAATPFLIGADGTMLAPDAGRLYLGVNQDQFSKPTGGKFEVHIDRVAAATATASGAAASTANFDFKSVFPELDAKLPYRVSDKPGEGGNPGDLVNFVLIGDKDQVTSAFKAAGWVVADKTNQDAVVGALL